MNLHFCILLFLYYASVAFGAVPTYAPTHSLQPSSPTTPPTPLPTPNLRQDVAVSALYLATNGANWKSNTNWMTGDPCDNSWYGVTCSTQDISLRYEINQINLASNSLSGSIPSQIGLLSTVTRIYNFQGNSLTGSLPSQVGSLSLCTAGLYFDGNSLTGSLPSELGQLTAMLSAVSLHSNGFSQEIPSELGLLSSMQFNFFLYSNSLTGTLPSQFGNLNKIRISFRVDKNSLSGSIPSELGQMVSMTNSLYLSTNRFSGSVPSQLGLLVGMLPEGLKLASNSFCGDMPVNVSLLDPTMTNNGVGTPCCEHSFPSSAPLTNYSFTCAPTPVPTQPSLVPTPLPTVVPFSRPSPVPTPAPSTLSPTTVNTHYIDFSFKIAVTSQYGEGYEPTLLDRSSLLTVTNDALGRETNKFKVYVPTPTSLPTPLPSYAPTVPPTDVPAVRFRGRHLLTSGLATWIVSFELETTQNQAEIIANTTAVLESSAYTDSIAVVLNATSVATSDIVSDLNTRVPTIVPSTAPTTWLPTQVPSNPPTPLPTRTPIAPTSLPTSLPTLIPSPLPTLTPSFAPTAIPSMRPTTFVENSLPFAGACIGGLIILSICVFYPLLRDSKPPIKALGPPRQQSVLDEECLEFLGKVFDEDYLPSIINRFELAMIPRVSATTVTRSSKIDENPLEVDTLTLMMMRIKEQEEAGEVNLEDLPKWTFGDLLELDEAFLVEEPLDLNQNQVNRFKNKVKKFKTNKFGVVVKLSKSLRGMKKGEIEMMENATLTKEELLEQNKIHQELQKQSTMKESQQAEAKDDAYGFLASKVKLKGARGRAIASKMKALGFDSRASFAYFDENVMNDSVLKSDLGLVAVEVRKFREACLKEKELLPEGDTSHQPKQQKTVTKRDQSPRPDRLSAGSTRKDVSRTDKPSTTSPSLLKEKTGESPKKQGKGKGMIRASTKEKVNNRGDKNPITTDTSLRGTIL